MADTNFRSSTTPTAETQPAAPSDVKQTDVDTKVEPLYSEYHRENGKPFLADYYQLGETWKDEAGGFPKEVAIIEEFIDHQIDTGELPNNIGAVKEALKKMEKVTNLSKHERPIVKVDTIAAYVKFLMECDHIKFNVKKYGNY